MNEKEREGKGTEKKKKETTGTLGRCMICGADVSGRFNDSRRNATHDNRIIGAAP